jgi:hypothetical protein
MDKGNGEIEYAQPLFSCKVGCCSHFFSLRHPVARHHQHPTSKGSVQFSIARIDQELRQLRQLMRRGYYYQVLSTDAAQHLGANLLAAFAQNETRQSGL